MNRPLAPRARKLSLVARRSDRQTETGTARVLAVVGIVVVLAAAVPLVATTQLSASQPATAYQLIDQRLEWMEEVAAYKWLHELPIEDPAREARVVNSAVRDALRFGVVPATAERFLRAQITAAKEVQAYWFERWRTAGGPTSAADLVSELRPELLRLGTEIIAALKHSADSHDWDAFTSAVTVDGLSEQSAVELYRAVGQIRHFEHRLAQILATGQVRIGTPGDYAPFSVRSADTQSYVGIDIDLALGLATALGVEPVFVETSWPTLLEDLAAGRYDIAVGGVSRTREREKLGFLSSTYHVGGKTPLARCSDVARFATLADIDQANVRLIVNPGGTNERYVDEHIHRARKTVHDDNQTIFQKIIDGAADVMITDRIEAQWQASRRPELCLTMPGTLTYQEKAFLLPQDADWLEFVNNWLDQQIANGTVAATFARHLGRCVGGNCSEADFPEVNE